MPDRKYTDDNRTRVDAAGSFLGVALKRENVSFPVGKVNQLQMFPKSFREFAQAVGEGALPEFLSDWKENRENPEP